MSLNRTGEATQIAKFKGPTWGPPGCCRPHVGPMNLAIRAWMNESMSWRECFNINVTSIGIPIIKIRRVHDRLIFRTGILHKERYLYIKMSWKHETTGRPGIIWWTMLIGIKWQKPLTTENKNAFSKCNSQPQQFLAYQHFLCKVLTHLPPVPHISVSELDQHWFREAYSAPSHYLNQCWVVVN